MQNKNEKKKSFKIINNNINNKICTTIINLKKKN